MKKSNLKLVPGDEPGIVLIGISSHENDFRLVWAINNQLKFNFIRKPNLIPDAKGKDESIEFSRFEYDDEEKYIRYLLISNRCASGTLFPEIKNIDYLVHVNGELITEPVEKLLKALKKIDIITGAYLIDTSKLKGADRLLIS